MFFLFLNFTFFVLAVSILMDPWYLDHINPRYDFISRQCVKEVREKKSILLTNLTSGIKIYPISPKCVFLLISYNHSVQFSSLAQLCTTLCNPRDCSTPGFPVHHHFSAPTQTHVHWVSDAIQPSHPLSSLPPHAFNHSQSHGLFKWVSSSHQVAKVLEFQLQHQSFQWIFRTDFL